MKFNIEIQHLGTKDDKLNNDRDMYHLTFKTYNAEVTGKFERSEIRHIIQILDNAI
jgi:hypothetical protein